MSKKSQKGLMVKISKEELFKVDEGDVEVGLRVDGTKDVDSYDFFDNSIDGMDRQTAAEHFKAVCAVYKAAGFDIISLSSEV